MSTSERVGIAILGVGRAGQIHIKNLLANSRVELLWVVEQNVTMAISVLESHRASNIRVAAINDLDKVLRDSRIEAVVICTPTDTHADLAIRALKAGKHVLCEKPVSEVSARVTECYDVADRCGRVLMAAFNRKFDASYRDIYNRVRSGEIGKPIMIRSTFRDTPLWLGARMFTQTILSHDIDMICWMANDTPDSVVCMGSANIQAIADTGDVDMVVVTMQFPNGTIGVLDCSRYCSYGYDIRLEVYGSNGMLKLDPMLQTTVKTFTKDGSSDAAFKPSFPERFETAYITELDHFVDVIRGKATLEVPRDQCERVGTVCDAIMESFETGKIVQINKNK